MTTDIIAQGMALSNYPRETLGAKLRRLAADADRGNPAVSPPWKVPPAYAQGVAKKPGNVISANGNWYVGSNTATTAGASGPSHVTADPVFDGGGSSGVVWSYYGPAQIAADDANAPSMSIASSPTLGNLYRPNAFADRFRVLGATPVAYVTSRWELDVFHSNAATVVQGLASGVEFMVDENAFEIEQIANTNGLTIIVDGRFLSLDAIVSAAADQWIKVTIPGGRRPHRVEIRGDRRGWYFGGVRLSATGQVYAPPVDGGPRLVCFEDSFGAGSSYGPWIAGKQIHRQFGDMLGIKDVWSFSRGGRGYIATDEANGAFYTYKQNLAEAIALHPDILSFGGSLNDRGTVGGNALVATDITAAALDTYRTARGLGFSGPIVVFGIASVDDTANGTTSKIAYVEQAVADAVTAFADPQCWFVPVRNDPVGPWVTGSWNYGTQTTSTNSSIITNTAGDKVHPSDIGHGYLASRRAAAFRKSVLLNIR